MTSDSKRRRQLHFAALYLPTTRARSRQWVADRSVQYQDWSALSANAGDVKERRFCAPRRHLIGRSEPELSSGGKVAYSACGFWSVRPIGGGRSQPKLALTGVARLCASELWALRRISLRL